MHWKRCSQQICSAHPAPSTVARHLVAPQALRRCTKRRSPQESQALRPMRESTTAPFQAAATRRKGRATLQITSRRTQARNPSPVLIRAAPIEAQAKATLLGMFAPTRRKSHIVAPIQGVALPPHNRTTLQPTCASIQASDLLLVMSRVATTQQHERGW